MSRWVTQKALMGRCPSLWGTSAAGWDGWEVHSPRGSGQTAVATAAQGVEVEQELGTVRPVEALSKLKWWQGPLQSAQTKIDLIVRINMGQ